MTHNQRPQVEHVKNTPNRNQNLNLLFKSLINVIMARYQLERMKRMGQKMNTWKKKIQIGTRTNLIMIRTFSESMSKLKKHKLFKN